MEQTTVKQPLNLKAGTEYDHPKHGRVMFIAVFPHDGACLVIERQDGEDGQVFDTCERSDLTPCNDGASYWPFLGFNCKERSEEAKASNALQKKIWEEQQAIVKTLEREAHSYGVRLEKQGNTYDHVKLFGECEVNYWPFSKGKTAHVKGEQKGIRGVSPEGACRLAQNLGDV